MRPLMLTRSNRRLTAILATILLLAISPNAGADDDVTLTAGEGQVTVTIDGQLFTQYVYQGHPKPILYPVIGPHGVEMTRHYPMKMEVDNEASDHPHQKSLWFTHGNVNGVDFWLEDKADSETRVGGRIVHQGLRVDGNTILAENNWIAPDDTELCSDVRKIVFAAVPNGRQIDYQVTIRATNGHVTFGDTKEGTMGVRTNPLLRLAMDERRGNHTAAGHCVNSEGLKDRDIWGKRAKWVDYWAPIEGNTVGLAIFDHPSNPRHPTWWHARHYGLVAANPFGVHDFEDGPEGIGNMLIASGNSVTFRYRFIFHEGDAQQAKIAEQYTAFANDEE